MAHIARRPGLVLATGVACVVLAALSPAGLHGRPVPVWSWGVWAAVFVLGMVTFVRAGLVLGEAFRRVSWLLPAIAVLTVPAALFMPRGSRVIVALALCVRAISAASMGAAVASWLGPSGLARAVRELHVPGRLADVFEATLLSLTVVLRQVRAMLRAREARRPAFGAWSDLLFAPADTVRGFGRLVASLLLRALERAEATEQARRARGGLA